MDRDHDRDITPLTASTGSRRGETSHDVRQPAAGRARLLSIRDAATELGISSWTLRDLIASGTLRAVQPPGVRRIYLDRRDIERAIEAWKS